MKRLNRKRFIQSHQETAISHETVKSDNILHSDHFTSDHICALSIKSLSGMDKGHLISICAPDGAGKTSIILSARQALADESVLWLIGQCQLVNQLVPFSFFQGHV